MVVDRSTMGARHKQGKKGKKVGEVLIDERRSFGMKTRLALDVYRGAAFSSFTLKEGRTGGGGKTKEGWLRAAAWLFWNRTAAFARVYASQHETAQTGVCCAWRNAERSRQE
uniref:Uncharacterized protein n=1 Tax=Oryza sativa subsp. japonica TaxID=39947 RepID=Q5ZA72_ORYSJ|nr:hypothetical protein [Oryza sativa Japonica Group]